jgi:hypothetical protein
MNRMNNHRVTAMATVLFVAASVLAVADAPIVPESIDPEPLSAAEEAGILFMREEEKLARDVYLALDDIWNIRVFENIARSEQQHMDNMLALIDRYGLDDPALTPGNFTNPELQAMYDALMDQGAQSMDAALRVGALIEEVDIEDLVADLAASDNEDIRVVYSSLLAASENHLRAFVSQIDQFGAGYEPSVLSREQYDEIIGSTSTRSRGAGPGTTGRAPRGRRG